MLSKVPLQVLFFALQFFFGAATPWCQDSAPQSRGGLRAAGENLAVLQEEPRGDPWVWLGKPRAHHVPVPESARVGRSQVSVTPGLLASWPLAGRHLPSLGPVYCGLQNSQLFLLRSPTPGPHGIHLQACSGQPGCACWCCPLCWTTGQGEGTEVRNATLIPASCPLLSVLLCL